MNFLYPGVMLVSYVIVLRRISDYGYITAPLYSPFMTRWGYGGRIFDLNPQRPHGGIFFFHRNDYCTCIVPERLDIVQVIQFLQIDLPKICVTKHGSKPAIHLNNNMPNFYKCQKDGSCISELMW